MEIVSYASWLSSMIRKVGLESSADSLLKKLENSVIGQFPVCANLAYRETRLACPFNRTFEFIPADKTDREYFICLPTVKGESKIVQSRIQSHLRRVFRYRKEAEEAEAAAKWGYNVVPIQLGKKVEKPYGDIPMAQFDDEWLNGCDPYLPAAFCWSPAGLIDSKEKYILPFSLEDSGPVTIAMEDGPFAGQLWVAYPGTFHEGMVWTLSIIVCLRMYGCVNPEDVPRIVQMKKMGKKLDETEKALRDALILELKTAVSAAESRLDSDVTEDRDETTYGSYTKKEDDVPAVVVTFDEDPEPATTSLTPQSSDIPEVSIAGPLELEKSAP